MMHTSTLIRQTGITLSLLSAATLTFAQDPQNGGWRRVGEQSPSQAQSQAPVQAPSQSQAQYPDQVQGQAQGQYPGPPQGQYPNQAPGQPQAGMNQNYPPPQNYPLPPQLTIKPGTFVTVRVNQPLSSDHNKVGDGFSATLVRPIVVDGVIVAGAGQIVGGRVAEAQKAGHVSGTSRLGIQLTDISLVDGGQVPIQSQLIGRNGGTSVGRDVGAVAGTTAAGAAIGAAADWGRGAAIGAGAGAAVGLIGVLLTRGNPTVIPPEAVLTFRVEAPVTISTDRAPQAFRYVDPSDYERPAQAHLQMRPGPSPPPPGGYYGGPGYYPYWPSIGFYYGPGYFYGYGPRFYVRGRYWH